MEQMVVGAEPPMRGRGRRHGRGFWPELAPMGVSQCRCIIERAGHGGYIGGENIRPGCRQYPLGSGSSCGDFIQSDRKGKSAISTIRHSRLSGVAGPLTRTILRFSEASRMLPTTTAIL